MKKLLFNIILSFGFGLAAQTMTRINCPQMKGFACGDLNGDGKPDIAVCSAEKENGGVFIYYQKNDHTYSAIPDRKIAFQAFDVMIADFDGDGKNDLACANYHPELRIFLAEDDFHTPVRSTSVNQWRPRIALLPQKKTEEKYLLCGAVLHRISANKKAVNCTVGMVPGEKGSNQRPFVCDIDLDGNPDVIMSTWPGEATKPGFNIYYNFFANLDMNRRILNGNDFLNFTNIHTPYQLSYLAADINADGAPDLVYSTPQGVYYMLQDRFNGFQGCEPQLLVKAVYPWVLYDDFTGSGKELAIITRNQAQYYKLPNKMPGRLQKFKPRPGDITELKSLDIDGDGKAEILMGNANGLWIIRTQ